MFVVQEELEGAERAVRALEARYPSSPDIATGLAQITRELGQLDRSASYARRAIMLAGAIAPVAVAALAEGAAGVARFAMQRF